MAEGRSISNVHRTVAANVSKIYAYGLDTFADSDCFFVFEHINSPDLWIHMVGASVAQGKDINIAAL